MNINNKDDMVKWEKLMFTNKGIEVLKTYLYTLTKMYFEINEYPYKMPPIMGIPIYKYTTIVNNSDDLLGRIKVLAQIFGITSINVQMKNSIKTLDLNGE